ncbi:BREX-1 system adenine-specific DNA-methyltransferase PglX [Nostoc punctiforme]|uniref:site-specific DNA-methyltransferase (adenine-specific) n=1 Tax=Nostoc punctiforme (strain ATCC 29133 / PCC 73102) TaxID=63737 RepID=B2J7Z7_NOSP7|nr:BREX-1 system adenine-specific DNA-methyltransferase PglX [Nostoc punctiforme]ACC83962.1 putative restriction enzyme [Nostoc punctiforme PCC 73102]
MNRTAIKNFAIWARRYLREQVKARAAQFGITHKSITEPQTVAGGLLVAGQTLNTTEANQYHQLRNRLQDLTLSSSQSQAVDALIDEIAYTWFNRLAALRFMEVNGYIGRVLSSSDPNLVDPDLLRDASSIAEMGDLPGLDLDTLNEWRSFANRDPNPDEFLYRRLLLAQCKALAEGIPALFDPRQNYQALFLPGNLLNQDSIVRRLVKEIPEEDWQNIEVVGWLYQFYISERKDEVIGAKSKVAAADIPAATQLFTPHWIVRYMVENSLGRLWLEAHPESRLREYMPYYLENPNDNGEGEKPQALTPQELTVIDPACGSGHILVYAFDLLFEIYKEQGYLERDIPALVLTHNLYGLDIDERAAQLASFAVLMKARAKNSRILRKSLALNITAVRPTHSQTLPPATELNAEDWQPLIEAFKDADNLGSLITTPAFDGEKLKWQLNNLEASDSLFRECVTALQALLLQAELLRNKYWVVVANPPYMGSKSLNDVLRSFANQNYPDSKSDAFSIFIERFLNMSLQNGFIGLMTPFTWMFLSSYEKLRRRILSENTITSLIRPEYHAFFDSAYVPICTFTILNKALPEYQGTFIDLNQFYGANLQPIKVLEAIKNPGCGYLYYSNSVDFARTPGSVIAYWLSEKLLNIFENAESLGNVFESKQGLSTANNDRFLRLWFEVNLNDSGFGLCSREEAKFSGKRWFPYNKGGEFRKWYGNQEFVINWNNDGEEIDSFRPKAVIRNSSYYFKPSVTWSLVSSSYFGVRYSGKGFIFDSAGSSAFCQSDMIFSLTGFLCSNITNKLIQAINPTLNFSSGNVAALPWISEKANIIKPKINSIVENCINISRQDWDNFETSWDFQTHPLLRHNTKHLSEAFTIWQSKSETAFRELQRLEEENNRYWIEAYGLQDELTSEVPDDQITIRHADLNKDIRSLISYAVGCMMGRYSLDKPGLIHAGQPFDPTLHQTLSASSDAIIPITDQAYFDNDIVTRFIEFLRVAYSPETLSENLNFIANALTLKNGESAQERIRRYFLQEFISDHIQTYKKRPIYWLFTSGKKRAFGALLYLHRYSEDALARIRTDYVLELQVKLDGEIARAQQQLDNTTFSAAKKAATNRLKELQAQQLELRDYQAKLQTQADARINLDLDDGVAYNYTRFKGLVYEGADLKIADLEKASQWKRELLK